MTDVVIRSIATIILVSAANTKDRSSSLCFRSSSDDIIERNVRRRVLRSGEALYYRYLGKIKRPPIIGKLRTSDINIGIRRFDRCRPTFFI